MAPMVSQPAWSLSTGRRYLTHGARSYGSRRHTVCAMGDDRTGDVRASDSEDVVPDTKDWTWTIGRACPECGFDASAVEAPEVAERVVALTVPWPAVLSRPEARRRPEPGVWSPLEYGCPCETYAVCSRAGCG